MIERRLLFAMTLLCALCTLLFMTGGEALAQISKHLTVHPSNPRYLSHDGQAVVILGAGQPLPGRKTENYRAYLDQMASGKTNHGRVWHLMPWESTAIYWPWARSGESAAKDGAAKFDLTKWDSNFWTRLKDACEYARTKGIYLNIMLFDECGIEAPQSSSDHRWDYHPFHPSNNINSLGLPSSGDAVPEFYALTNSKLKSIQEQYVAKLIAETSRYPNVFYEICNEYTGPWDWEKYWIDFVRARCSNIITVNRLGSIPSAYWTDSKIGVVKFHWGTTSPSTINSNMISYYSKNRAVNYDETPEKSTISSTNYRNMLWAAFVGGGHIHLENGYNASASWNTTLRAMNFIRDNDIRFAEMAPSNSLVTKTPGGSAYTLAKPGSQYVTYLVGSGSGTMNISLASGATYTAKAYNPSSGAYTNLSVSGNTISGIPSYSSDLVIYVEGRAATVDPPNISLSLAVDKTQAVPGDTLTYTLTYKNTADGDANSVLVECPAPSNTTYVSGSATSGGTYDSAVKSVKWNFSTVAAGAGGALTFKVTVN